MKDSDFVQALLNQLPDFDKAIMRDCRPESLWINPKPYLDPLPSDVRFLPNQLRPLWAFRRNHPKMLLWQIGRKWHLKTSTVKDRLADSEWIIDERLRQWIKSLPIPQRRRERWARQKRWRREHWGFKPVYEDNSVFNRFRSVWPNIKSDNLKSEWPPPHRLNCVGVPCDPVGIDKPY